MNNKKMRTKKEIREECLIKPFKKRRCNKINVITAPTNIGKTYSIFNKIIPTSVDDGVTHFVVTAPDTMIHTQSLDEYADDLHELGIFLYTKNDLSRFMKAKHSCVILLTNAMMNRNQEKLIKFQQKIGVEKFMLLVDEGHYGGTTEYKYLEPNTGYPPTKESKFVFSSLLKKLSKDSKNIVAYTATPLYEMLLSGQDLWGESISAYNILNEPHQWPTTQELSKLNSRLGGYVFVKDWIKDNEPTIIDTLLDDKKVGFFQYEKNTEWHVNNLKNQAVGTEHEEQINKIIDPRTLVHLVVGAEYDKSSPNSSSQDETLKYLQSKLKKSNISKEDKNKYSILVISSKGCNLHSINGDSKLIKKVDIIDELNDGDVKFLISVDMLKMGFNCSRIIHTMQIRRRKQVLVVVNGVIQTLSRGNRQYFGLKEIDTFEKLQELFSRVEKNVNLRIALLDYVKHFNQHFAILPDEPIYRDGIREYKDKYVSEEPFVWGTCTGAEHDCDDPFCTINT